MTTARNQMEIKEPEIRKHYPEAFQLLSHFDYAPRLAKPGPGPKAPSSRSPGIPGRRKFRSTTPGLATKAAAGSASGVRVIDRICAIDPDDPIESETQAHGIRALRRAIAVASATVELYGGLTPLGQLMQQNLHGKLKEGQRVEFGELLSGASLVGLFTFANVTAFLLGDSPGAADGGPTEIGQIEEIVLDNPNMALKGALWELDQKIGQHGTGDENLPAVLLGFCELLMEEVGRRAAGARHLEGFRANSYRVAADDFEIEGFTPTARARSSALSMAFKKPEEVVGNHIAKHQCLKLAKMLMAYDFTRQLNPFAELGGFVFTFLGDGKPGTGKTTLIQMLAGLLHGYCEGAGYPFRYENLSTDAVDSYQGRSGQNAKAFIRSILDPHIIGFGTIDDIDQVAGRRGDRQTSAGQQEITAVLMEAFSGANTVVRGNCTFGMFSNYPEQVDDALRQRAGARFLIDGPQSREDYIDILHLLLGSNHAIPLGQHDLYAGQELRSAVAKSYEKHGRPQDDKLLEVIGRAEEEFGSLDSIEALGHYLAAIKQADERFTGRAIKNITDAVKVRAMDIELPDEWMAQPDLFLRQDYDKKKAMIGELMKPITAEMVLQEINRYADSEFRYAGTADESAIEEMVRDLGRRSEAQRRFANRSTDPD